MAPANLQLGDRPEEGAGVGRTEFCRSDEEKRRELARAWLRQARGLDADLLFDLDPEVV